MANYCLDRLNAGLSLKINDLLDAVCLSLVRQPGLTREAEGALGLLQRYRAWNSGKFVYDEDSLSVEDEIRLHDAIEKTVQSTADHDQTVSQQNSLQPPDVGAVEDSIRKALYKNASGHIANFTTIDGGYSKQTSLFDWVHEDGKVDQYAMRRDTPFCITGTSVAQEYPLLNVLYSRGALVPEPVLLETQDPSIREPYIITRRVAGQCIGTAFLEAGESAFNPTPALAKFLAELHAIPHEELEVEGFGDTPFDANALAAQIDCWSNRYLSSRECRSPVMDQALAFLIAEAEAGLQEPGSIVHGDASFYNLLFENHELTCVLDWELAHFGAAAWDLAGVKDAVEAFGSYEDFLTLYESFGGKVPPKRTLAYYDVFRLVSLCTLCVLGTRLYNQGGIVGLDLVHLLFTMYPRFLSQIPNAMQCYYDTPRKE